MIPVSRTSHESVAPSYMSPDDQVTGRLNLRRPFRRTRPSRNLLSERELKLLGAFGVLRECGVVVEHAGTDAEREERPFVFVPANEPAAWRLGVGFTGLDGVIVRLYIARWCAGGLGSLAGGPRRSGQGQRRQKQARAEPALVMSLQEENYGRDLSHVSTYSS